MSGVTGRAGPKREPIIVRAPIRVSPAVYARLSALKDERQQQLSRQVSFTEVIELLLDRAGAA